MQCFTLYVSWRKSILIRIDFYSPRFSYSKQNFFTSLSTLKDDVFLFFNSKISLIIEFRPDGGLGGSPPLSSLISSNFFCYLRLLDKVVKVSAKLTSKSASMVFDSKTVLVQPNCCTEAPRLRSFASVFILWKCLLPLPSDNNLPWTFVVPKVLRMSRSLMTMNFCCACVIFTFWMKIE